jgi:hypothetical protein
MKTLKDFAKSAKVCAEYVPANVSGVVFSFAEWMQWACDNGLDTRSRNEHPITKAFIVGIVSCAGDPNSDSDAYVKMINELEELIA